MVNRVKVRVVVEVGEKGLGLQHTPFVHFSPNSHTQVRGAVMILETRCNGSRDSLGLNRVLGNPEGRSSNHLFLVSLKLHK